MDKKARKWLARFMVQDRIVGIFDSVNGFQWHNELPSDLLVIPYDVKGFFSKPHPLLIKHVCCQFVAHQTHAYTHMQNRLLQKYTHTRSHLDLE